MSGYVQCASTAGATASSLATSAINISSGNAVLAVVQNLYAPNGPPTLTLSSGGYASQYLGSAFQLEDITLASAPLTGATSGTLLNSWSGTPGTKSLMTVFSDGEERYATFTNGSTSFTWAGPLTGGSFTTDIEVGYETSLDVLLVTNLAAGATTATVNAVSSSLNYLWIGEYNGLTGAVNALNWDNQVTPTGANAVNTGPVVITTLPSVFFCVAASVKDNSAVTAGTILPFNGRPTPLQNVLVEDTGITVSNSYNGTFTCGGNRVISIGIALPVFADSSYHFSDSMAWW